MDNNQMGNNFTNGQNNNFNQNDYYSNDAYYNNSNYSNDYNDTSYEEKPPKKGIGLKILIIVLVLLVIVILLLKFCTGGTKVDNKYNKFRNEICEAAKTYVEQNSNVLDTSLPGRVATIRLQKLSDANLIGARLENPYYDGGLFKKGENNDKYYSLDNSVRLTVLNDLTISCELVENGKDVTAPILTLNGDAVLTFPIGTEFEDPGCSASDDYDGDISNKVERSGNVSKTIPGEYVITYTVTDSAGNSSTVTRKIIYEEYEDLEITLGSVLDGKTPTISLKGSNPYCLVKGNKFVEPGAVANDNVDGDITDRIAVTNKVTGNLLGSFRITYKVEDSSGNEAIAYRAVIVSTECPKENEQGETNIANTAPKITLVGKGSITINKGENYMDLGATAYDKEDGDITTSIVTDTTKVNTNVAGTYKVTYRVTDSGGLSANAVRTVTVKAPSNSGGGGSTVSNTAPKITLVGDSTVNINKGDPYRDLGATASDKEDGDITRSIVVDTSNVNINAVGRYTVTYKVTDKGGLSASATRTVVVNETVNVSNTAPRITLKGSDTLMINKGETYVENGATAYDNEDGDITNLIITDSSNVDVNNAGRYIILYTVTDKGGLSASASRTVIVNETSSSISPYVTFTERKANFEVYANEGNDSMITPPKAVNEKGESVKVTTVIEDYSTKVSVNKIDWSKAGKYRVIYTAKHSNGNISQSAEIVVSIYYKLAEIGGNDSISITRRDSNCSITEADLVKGGVTFTSGAMVDITPKENQACIEGTYQVLVGVTKDGYQINTKAINVVVKGTGGNITPGGNTQPETPGGNTEPETPGGNTQPVVTPPGKVVIKTNSANATDPYNKSGKWNGKSVTTIDLTFTSTPGANTQIARFEWSDDCNTSDGMIPVSSTNTGTFIWNREGKNQVCIRAVTTAGISGPWSDPVNMYLDLTGPTVRFTHTWADGEDDWYNTPSVVVSYSGEDNLSGIDHFEYTYDDVKGKYGNKVTNPTTIEEKTGSVTITENMEPNRPKLFVYVRAVDVSGNAGEWTANPANVNLDTVKPYAPTLTVEGNNTSVVRLKAQFKDGTSTRPSGFGKLIYTINNGNEIEELTQTITAPTNNTNANVTDTFKVWAVDKAGNRSNDYATETVTVAPINVKATSVKLSNNGNQISNGSSCLMGTTYVGDTIVLNATPEPSNSEQNIVTCTTSNYGVAEIKEATTNSCTVSVKESGNAIITVKIGDVSTTCSINSFSRTDPSKDPSVTPGGPGTGTGTGTGTGGGYNPGTPGNPSQEEECLTQSQCNNLAKSCTGISGCTKNQTTGCWSYSCQEKPQTEGECNKDFEVWNKTTEKCVPKPFTNSTCSGRCTDGYKCTKFGDYDYRCVNNGDEVSDGCFISANCGGNCGTDEKCAQSDNCNGRGYQCVKDTSCPSGEYKNPATGKCENTCRHHSLDTGGCDLCVESYSVAGTGKNAKCVPNIPHCTKYNLDGSCQSCIDVLLGSHYTVSDGKCITKCEVKDCAKCVDGKPNKCELYNDGCLDKDAFGQCNKCDTSSYKLIAGSCKPLILGCAIDAYDVNGNCTRCEDNSKPINGKCDSVNIDCNVEDCNKCVEGNPNKCADNGCKYGYVNTGKSCVKKINNCSNYVGNKCVKCEVGYNLSLDASSCKQTVSNCAEFYGYQKCKVCATGYELTDNYTCKSIASNPVPTCSKGTSLDACQSAMKSCTYGSTGCHKTEDGCYAYTCLSSKAQGDNGSGSYSKLYNCFTKGTKVLTISGYKDIDKIEIGEYVLSYNEDTKKSEYKKVYNTLIHENVDETLYTLTLSNGSKVDVTGDHRLYVITDNGYEWIRAKDLKVGNILMNSLDEYVEITNISSKEIHETVYNLEVLDNHTYYVTENNVLVHNAK